MQDVCGFVVVRKPEYAVSERYRLNLRLDSKTYRGVDRLPWEDLDDAYYAGTISEELLRVRDKIEAENKGLLGPRLIRDYSDALFVWQAFEEKTEIIALWSPQLAQNTGSVSCNGELQPIGFDCISLGEWSVLIRGAFYCSHEFSGLLGELNEYGLLKSDDDCDKLFSRYIELSRSGYVEPLMDNPTAIHMRVFLIGGEPV
jgi:hypothetical protein